MRKPKKGTKRSGRVGYFMAIFGNDPVDDDNLGGSVDGTLQAGIDDAIDMLDGEEGTVTVYELVPRARVELAAPPEPKVVRL